MTTNDRRRLEALEAMRRQHRVDDLVKHAAQLLLVAGGAALGHPVFFAAGGTLLLIVAVVLAARQPFGLLSNRCRASPSRCDLEAGHHGPHVFAALPRRR